jgi:hypothetical protein
LPERFPDHISMTLFLLVEAALTGNRTQSFEELFEQHAPRQHFMARTDIQRGCAYVCAVKAKELSDSAPILTVATWFGVNRRTVHNWLKAVGDRDLLAKLYPDETNRGVTIESVAKLAGARYRESGRGQMAVRARASKRRRSKKHV